MEKVFFIEDEDSIYDLIDAMLSVGGYEKKGFKEPLSMLKCLDQEKPDLIVLDLMLPNMDGFEVLKKIKDNCQYNHIPVIILSAKSSEVDKVKGLDMGASDYITKPFGVLEFISRVKANLRKSKSLEPNIDIITIRELQLNITKHCFIINNNIVDLTVKEYNILKLLMENPSVVITREKFLNTIWGYNNPVETRALDMHIKTIRDKISKFTNINYIETIRGIGYVINE